MPQAIAAAGAIVHYLKHQLRRNIDHLTSLRCDAPSDHVVLDAATQTNLELVESRNARDTSLLAVLDRTITPMGGRKLRAWILQPLRNLTELECRQQMIARFVARAGFARIAARFAQIDPRYRARGWAIEPSLGQRARSRRAQNFARTNSEVEKRAAKATRSTRVRRDTHKREWKCRVTCASSCRTSCAKCRS